MKKLPIGIQTFSKIRDIDDNYYYVDKTADALRLIEQGSYYFLSRPRRFGKSLFLDTLAEIFLGHRDLFKGLHIYDRYDWSKKYPVIRISFGTGDFKSSKSIARNIKYALDSNIKNLRLNMPSFDIEEIDVNFRRLIENVYEKNNQKVVILIDEYDKPILDNITNKEMALAARDILRSFYSAIKDSDRYIKFVFITGVSKFSKMNLFSGLNNLEDITVKSDFATITGYTHGDLQEIFSERLEGVDLELVRKWYNGYNYFGEPIYNPFDILLFLSNSCKFSNYWWKTGNPSFLIEILRQKDYFFPDLEEAVVSEETLDAFDVEKIDILALLWQTGYLTFDKKIKMIDDYQYKMRVPNLEIQKSLNSLFFDALVELKVPKSRKLMEVYQSIINSDFEALKEALKSLFAAIPYSNYTKNRIAHYEGFYSSVIYAFILSIGFDVISEDITSRGRIDMTIKTLDSVIILEFKVDSDEPAIYQIKEKGYFSKYLKEGKEIHMVGINFSSSDKNITNFEHEKLEE